MDVLVFFLGALMFGLLAIIGGYISHFVVNAFGKYKTRAECADWNKEHIMEKSLFVTGIIMWCAVVSLTVLVA